MICVCPWPFLAFSSVLPCGAAVLANILTALLLPLRLFAMRAFAATEWAEFLVGADKCTEQRGASWALPIGVFLVENGIVCPDELVGLCLNDLGQGDKLGAVPCSFLSVSPTHPQPLSTCLLCRARECCGVAVPYSLVAVALGACSLLGVLVASLAAYGGSR